MDEGSSVEQRLLFCIRILQNIISNPQEIA